MRTKRDCINQKIIKKIIRISLANEICKKYRREGKYFDEIINE